jgi:hypothetical protein
MDPESKHKQPVDWAAPFLEAFKKTGNLTIACRMVGIQRAAVYRHKAEDSEFARAFGKACESVIEVLESEVCKRAIAHSNDSLRLWLRARERYSLVQSDQGKAAISAEDLSDDELARIACGDWPAESSGRATAAQSSTP